jgi:hypothetical protein
MKQGADLVTRRMSKMLLQRSFTIGIITALASAACLSAVANASIPTTITPTPVVATAPKAVAAPKPKPTAPAVTANTAQFSCPNCANGNSAISLTTTLGMMNQVTAASMNLGSGIFHPEHLSFPAQAAMTPDATPLQNDPAYMKKWQDDSYASATFTGPDEMMDGDGNVSRQKLGEWFVSQGIISDQYADEYFPSDSKGSGLLKTKSSSAIFSIGDDDSDT